MELNELKLPVGVKDKDIIAIINKDFSGYDKMLHSKCRHPDKYGIQPVADAIESVCKSFGISPQKPRKPDKRTLPCRVSCRLSKSEYSELQQLIIASDCDTMQDYLAILIRRHLRRCKKRDLGGAA